MTTKVPAAIVCETRVHSIDGEEIRIKDEKFGDSFNLSTGDASIARLIGGVRYDTANASLVVGAGEYVGFGEYALARLYRTAEGKFFRMALHNIHDSLRIELLVVDDWNDVLVFVRNLVPESRIVEFLREWYCSGLLPIDDQFVREWVESVLPADKCEEVLIHLGTRHWRPETPET